MTAAQDAGDPSADRYRVCGYSNAIAGIAGLFSPGYGPAYYGHSPSGLRNNTRNYPQYPQYLFDLFSFKKKNLKDRGKEGS
jgi:hypothetical protein